MPKPTRERRNAPPGSSVKRKLVEHTAQSLSEFQALSERWGQRNGNEVFRRALSMARKATEEAKT